jgi:3-deoxy-D-manno-octulosonate 8-phosphate phosphatase (KDO 8-P phosphatase)
LPGYFETKRLGRIDGLITDFDGVLTDNRVYVSQDGSETVRCSRADGLAFRALNILDIPTLILSTETNPVVEARAKKVGVPLMQGATNKLFNVETWVNEKRIGLEYVLYVGNDVNDYTAMSVCGFRACPIDSHKLIKQICNIQLKLKGGDGIIREIVEDIFEINLLDVLY